jgi:hypothetical protein
MTDQTHKFTQSGLGKAPFRFVAVRENVIIISGEASKAGGTCDHCMTGIRWEHVIRSADGKTSVVGSSCISKVGDRGLIKLAAAARTERNREARNAKHLAAFELVLDAQRERNGGLTDNEIAVAESQRIRQAEEVARLARVDAFRGVSFVLHSQNSRFAMDIAHELEHGSAPRGRGVTIVAEICAKQKGRKNTAAFAAEFERVSALLAT